jgi:diguanylate cyclase (GGDEF)-like protein/PAS domain S-box-containing protein
MAEGGAEVQGERVLIVEDERIIAFDLQRRLKSFGFEVIGSCSSGAEAIELCSHERPDIVLMDIMLEGDLDGIETAKILLETRQIPSIFLTAYSDAATLERAKAAQPLAYIIKPFKERELYTTIDVALYKSKADERIRDQERWSGAILNSISDALIALTPELKVHYANPAAAALLDLDPETLTDRPLKSLFTLLDEETLIPLPLFGADPSRDATVYFRQTLLQSAEGTIHHVEGSLSRVKFDRLPVGSVLTLRDVSSVRKLAERLDFLAKHDALTGLANRKEFMSLLADVHLRKVKACSPASMLYLDLDQFKLVNDTCGHLAGDELLRQTADLLKQLQDQDVTSLARLGGDEFALVFENSTTERALEKAWVVKHKLNSHEFIWQSTVFRVKASMGLVALEAGFDDVKSVLAAADDACYLAKEEGGNRIKVYAGDEDAFLKRRGEMTWIARLNRALEKDRFVLYGQTIEPLDPALGLRPKVEVLLRLLDDQDRIVPPADFIPAAERYNLMPQIDRWVLKKAISRWKDISQAHPGRPCVCINLSGESIADTNLASYIKHEFKKHGADPKDFCFEITETATIANLGRAVSLIQDLKSVGALFALDDFGSGLSSFAYLRNLPVDYLKIDGVFVKNIDTDPVNFAMVEGIQKISRVMGLKTIAEFAATDGVLATLRTIGIDYAQGYALSKPEPL